MENSEDESYDGTPSFYNSRNFFEKYLGETSYYMALQDAVSDLATIIDPSEIIELGTGTGETSFRLSNEFPNKPIKAIDNRENVIKEARSQKKSENENIDFITADMTEYVSQAKLPELVVMMYSFHHIQDPLKNKKNFLRQCYHSLPNDGYLCIAEGFLPEMNSTTEQLQSLWEKRGLEAYSSTFWASLDGLDSESISKAQKVGDFSRQHEKEAGENVVTRDGEYLVSRDWLENQAENKGFDVVLSEPCNSLGEGVVLLQKSR